MQRVGAPRQIRRELESNWMGTVAATAENVGCWRIRPGDRLSASGLRKRTREIEANGRESAATAASLLHLLICATDDA